MSRRAAGIYVFLILLFGVFCYFAHRYDYFTGDLSLTLWLQEIPRAWFEPIMRHAPYIVGLGILVGLQLWLKSRWKAFIFLAITAVTAGLIAWLLKLAVERPRPELVQVMVATQGSSFPGGHTAIAAVVGGFVFYLAPKLVKQRASLWLLRALVAVVILSVCVSRIYLGAHWLSDVVGGLFLAGLLLYPAIVLYKRYEAKHA